jgi:RNA polymerase sigma factor (TIGR02999 family)
MTIHASGARNFAHGIDGDDAARARSSSQPVNAPAHDVTALLQAWGAGDIAARDELMTVVYHELHRCAAAQLRRERRGIAVQPTSLVHEAYVRLVDQRRVAWQNRGHFFGLACQMMRRVLVDRARARRRGKRSGRWERVMLDDALATPHAVDVDVLDLHAALTRLASFDPRKSRIAELRFFGGLSLAEASDALGISPATAERDWQAARAWLFKELRGNQRHDP